jgi:hypothetical protein
LVPVQLAYACDQYGNRVLEEHFDGDRTKICDIAYTWEQRIPTHIMIAHSLPSHTTPFSYRNGRIQFGRRFSGTVTVCSPGGRVAFTERICEGESVTIPAAIAAATYLVRGPDRSRQ